MMDRKSVTPIIIVQGMQFGSEAKGAVAAYLCLKRDVRYAVRTGAVNAGHTVYWPEGESQDKRAFKMQQLPTGWVNPKTKLVIGAGAFVHPEILANELETVRAVTGEDLTARLVLDDRCSLHLPEHQAKAKVADRHHIMGATGKGCSEAMMAKLRDRGKGYELFKTWWCREGKSISALRGIVFGDTVELLHSAYDRGDGILLEGTQGSLLDLHLGPYPYTTHKQTQAAQWVIEAGLAPNMEYEIVGVARTFPIRVAGNSGPMMSGETTWPNIARSINRKLMRHHQPQRVKDWAVQEFEKTWVDVARSGKYHMPVHADGSENYDLHKWTAEERVEYRVALSELPADVMRGISLPARAEIENLFEFTTVTNKLRRVAEWNADEVAWAARVNRVNWVALTFWNYWFPETWGQMNVDWDRAEYQMRLDMVEEQIRCPVKLISTGPYNEHLVPTPTRG